MQSAARAAFGQGRTRRGDVRERAVRVCEGTYGETLRAFDDEGLRVPPTVCGRMPTAAGMLVAAETMLFMAIAVALVVTAAIVFVRAAPDLIAVPVPALFAATITQAVNDLCSSGSCWK